MYEKESRNPLVVIGAIIFLSLFIILPPVFRTYIPKKEPVKEAEIVQHTLLCERLAASENRKITSRIFYENDVAINNIMTFIVYTPTDEELDADSQNDTLDADDTIEANDELDAENYEPVSEMTVNQEIEYLKGISGVDVQENASQTVIEITADSVNDNKDEEELKNYLLETELAIEHFEAKGYTCTKSDN